MKLSLIEKQLLFESAKKILAEIKYPIVPVDPVQAKKAGPQTKQNSSGYDEDSTKSDEFQPDEFHRFVRQVYLAYKAFLGATENYIESLDKYFLNFLRGQWMGPSTYFKVEQAMNMPNKKAPDQASRKSLNKTTEVLNKLMNKFQDIVDSTNVKFNKSLYQYFFNFFENQMKEYRANTYDYFSYVAYISQNYLRLFDFAREVPDKEWPKNYHKYSYIAKDWVSSRYNKYYKTPFEGSGTNKGFYRTVRDMFMDEQDFRDPDPVRKNAYSDYEANYGREALPYNRSNVVGARNIFHAEENRLLNKIHDLTKRYIDSNYKDVAANEEIKQLRQQIETARKQMLSRTNDTDLQSDLDKIDKKYQGWGAWKDFKEKPSQGRDSGSSQGGGSEDSDRRQPRYGVGNYDPELEDYRKK